MLSPFFSCTLNSTPNENYSRISVSTGINNSLVSVVPSLEEFSAKLLTYQLNSPEMNAICIFFGVEDFKFSSLIELVQELGYLNDQFVIKFLRKLLTSHDEIVQQFCIRLAFPRLDKLNWQPTEIELLRKIFQLQDIKELTDHLLNKKLYIKANLQQVYELLNKEKQLHRLKSVIATMLAIYYDEKAFVWIFSKSGDELLAATRFLKFLGDLMGSSLSCPSKLWTIYLDDISRTFCTPLNQNWNGFLNGSFSIYGKISLDFPSNADQVLFHPNEKFFKLIQDCQSWLIRNVVIPNQDLHIQEFSRDLKLFFWNIPNFLKPFEMKFEFSVLSLSKLDKEFSAGRAASFLTPELREYLALDIYPNDPVTIQKFCTCSAPKAYIQLKGEMWFASTKINKLIEFLERMPEGGKLFATYLENTKHTKTFLSIYQ